MVDRRLPTTRAVRRPSDKCSDRKSVDEIGQPRYSTSVNGTFRTARDVDLESECAAKRTSADACHSASAGRASQALPFATERFRELAVPPNRSAFAEGLKNQLSCRFAHRLGSSRDTLPPTFFHNSGADSMSVMPVCVPKTSSELMTRWNRLSWRNDRAVLFRFGRPGRHSGRSCGLKLRARCSDIS